MMAARIPSGEDGIVSDINVTPMIDVMLVLLIIFMVAAPLSTVDVAVDLPASAAKPQPRPEKPLYVSLRPDLSVAVGDAFVAPERLAAAIEAAASDGRETRIFLRADQSVPYGDVMKILNVLRKAGFLKVALVGLEQAS